MSDDENRPVRTGDLPWTEFRHGGRFAVRYRRLSSIGPGQPCRIGVGVEELAPGAESCPAHWHTMEEEHVLILSGALTVRIADREHVMEAGDYVRFPAGRPEAHNLRNHTDEPCAYVIIGGNEPHDVCVYPDSDKIKVKATGEIYDKSATRDYFDGEA
jgi:uncharacterized cupin superfamily protein